MTGFCMIFNTGLYQISQNDPLSNRYYINIGFDQLTQEIVNLFRERETNPNVPSASFLYPLKIENLTVFLCFQGIEKGWIQIK